MEDLHEEDKERDAQHKAQAAKKWKYAEDKCPSCGRWRVMLGSDNKRRCEKCGWCIEDSACDTLFLVYLSGLL